MHAKLFTDGSCLGNPGPGGWAFLLRLGDEEIRKAGGTIYTTNNRMELLAVIEGIKAFEKNFPKETDLEVHSDSSWVVKTMTENWKRKKNLDLWDLLTPLLAGKRIRWVWVKGHAGHKENEDCDARALEVAKKQEKKLRENPDLAKDSQKNLFENL